MHIIICFFVVVNRVYARIDFMVLYFMTFNIILPMFCQEFARYCIWFGATLEKFYELFLV